jgi:antitoxin FitA
MANIILRDLDDELKEKLRVRASQHGQSMAAELRDIVRDALLVKKSTGVESKKLFAELRKLSASRSNDSSTALIRQMRDTR